MPFSIRHRLHLEKQNIVNIKLTVVFCAVKLKQNQNQKKKVQTNSKQKHERKTMKKNNNNLMPFHRFLQIEKWVRFFHLAFTLFALENAWTRLLYIIKRKTMKHTVFLPV